MRIFALSDVHVDFQLNMSWLQCLSRTEYADDALILAGDVTDDLKKLEAALSCVRARFAHVFFMPGNHELWIRREECADSLEKLRRVLRLCDSVDVKTSPAKVGESEGDPGAWIVPLLSWYMKPEEGAGSLFVPKKGEDPTLEMWSDNYFIKWPSFGNGATPAEHFLRMNERHLGKRFDAPVISFSHFLPRVDLIFSTKEEREAMGGKIRDPNPRFNFSRVAGCGGLEKQIRRLGSVVHVYGHQHRNRRRLIDGVLYVSHCLGYPRERERDGVLSIRDGPQLIWDTVVERRDGRDGP